MASKNRNKIDWLAIRQAYITSQDVTLKELADLFGISESSVFLKSRDENWIEKRKQFQEKVFEKTCNKIANKTANKLSKIADKLADRLEQASNELNIHEEVNMFGKIVKKDTKTIRVNKLSALIKALTQMQKVEIEKEKLEIERAKLTNGDETENKVDEFIGLLKGALTDEE